MTAAIFEFKSKYMKIKSTFSFSICFSFKIENTTIKKMPHYLHFLYHFRWQHLSRPILKVAATRMASAAICIGYPRSSSISKGFGSAESKEKGVGCGR